MGTIFTSKPDVSVGGSAQSVVMGDVNGDGKLDMIVAAYNASTVSVRLGDGAGGFSGTTEIGVGAGPNDVVVADVNGDGDLDLLTVNYHAGTASVRIGDGAGGFFGSTEIGLGTRPTRVAIADVNGDGKLDLVASNSGSNTVSVRLGDGLGGFSGTTELSAGVSPGAVALADVNGDGKLDLLVANSEYGTNTVLVRLGDGSGGFSGTTAVAVGYAPQSVALGDINGDGKLDLVTASAANGTASVRFGDGLGGFSGATDITMQAGGHMSNYDVGLVDINNDGKLDMVLSGTTDWGTVAVLLGDGAGNFSPAADIDGFGSNVASLAFGDLNRDGTIDLMATNFDGHSVSVRLIGENTVVSAISTSGDSMLGIGDTLTFTLMTDNAVTVTGTPELTLSNGAHAVYAGLDSNGYPTFTYTVVEGDTDTADLGAAGLDTTNGTVDGPEGDLSFAVATSIVMGSRVTHAIAADMNGDGKLDLVTANSQSSTVSVALGDGNGGYATPIETGYAVVVQSLVASDVNGDGKLDLLTANGSGNDVSVLLGKGNGTFSSKPDVPAGASPTFVTTADVNSDGKLDFLSANVWGSSVSVRLGDGLGGFSGSTNIGVIGRVTSIAVGDINGDGKLDFLANNSSDSDFVSVRLGDGRGGFTPGSDVAVGNGVSSLVLTDVNGDGKIDIVAAVESSSSVSVLLGDGAGNFADHTDFGAGGGAHYVAVGDVNGDGKLDIVTANLNSSISVLLGDGAGGFSNSINIAVDSDPRSIALADLNGDGKLDLLVSQPSKNAAAVILNTSSTTRPFDGTTIPTASGADTGRSVDATRPAAPVVDLAADTGVSDSDGLTRDASLAIAGKETDSTLSYSIDGGAFSSAYDPASLADGRHTVSVKQADKTGNISDAVSITFTLDRTAASAPVVTLTADTGADNTDRVTSNGALTIGGVEAVATLSYVVDDVAVGSYDPTKLAEGDHTVRVTQTDKAGNISAETEIAFTIDRTTEVAKVTSITSDGSGTLGIGDTITFTLTTDHSVTVKGAPELTLSNGTHAIFAGLDSNGYPTFAYTVVEGDADTADLAVTGLDTTKGTVDGPEGELAFGAVTSVDLGSSAYQAIAADFNGDGRLDLVTANGFARTVSVALGDGAGGFATSTQIVGTYYPASVAAGDINGDGKLDLLVASTAGKFVGVLLGRGDGTFSQKSDVVLVNPPTFITMADVNGDGKLDFLTISGDNSAVSVRLGDGLGGFSGSTEIDVAGYVTSVATGDVNGDGKLDLVSANGVSGSVSVRLGDGQGSFSAGHDIVFNHRLHSVALADVNGDGKLDIVTASEQTKVASVLLGDGMGNFERTDFAVGNASRCVAVGDVNGDGELDIVTAGFLGGAVSVLLGDGDGGFSDRTDISSGSIPYSLALADLNGDGRLDLLMAEPDGNRAITILNTSSTTKPFDGTTVSTASGAETGRAVDATRPDAPDVTLTADTGASDSDKITGNGALSISGTEKGATLSYVVDGGIATDSYDPAALAYGRHTVNVTQTDLAGNVSDAGTITFILQPPVVPPTTGNAAPVVADDLDNQAVIAGTSTTFAFAANAFTDTDGDALTYATGSLPSWLSFDAVTRTFTAAPSAADLGMVSVTVTANDGAGGSVADVFDIVVSSPTSGVTGFDLSDTTVEENAAGGTIIGQLAALDTTETFEFTLARNPKGAFAIVDGNLVVADGADLDFETRDHYRIKVVGTDEAGDHTSETFTISVIDAAEVIKGTAKADILLGGKGADIVRGLRSDDVLKGRGGDDRLKGGAGADTFVFGPGHDTVRDFHVRQDDIIDLRHAAGIDNFQDLKTDHAEQTDQGLVITDDGGSTMLLLHIGMADLRVDSFHF